MGRGERIYSEDFTKCGRRWCELSGCSALTVAHFKSHRKLFLMLSDNRAPEHLSIFMEALDHKKALIKFRIEVYKPQEDKIVSEKRAFLRRLLACLELNEW